MTPKTLELQRAIAKAVAMMDRCDGSRTMTYEMFDEAREVLKSAYGVGFEMAVTGALDDFEEHDFLEEIIRKEAVQEFIRELTPLIRKRNNGQFVMTAPFLQDMAEVAGKMNIDLLEDENEPPAIPQ